MSNSNHIAIRHAKIYKNVYKYKVEVGKVPDASGRSCRAAGYPQIAVVLAVHLTSPGYGAARLLPVVVVEEAAIG